MGKSTIKTVDHQREPPADNIGMNKVLRRILSFIRRLKQADKEFEAWLDSELT